MASIKRLSKSFFMLLLPTVILLVVVIVGMSFWLLQKVATPPVANYLITPEKYLGLSTRGSKITDETWANKDGSTSRGWMLPGTEGSPAIILLHRYGADRSHILNLGIKLNEVTNFTILMPDLRGHGAAPLVKHTTFGALEADDLQSAIEFLRTAKAADKGSLIGKEIGVYGIEIGAYAAAIAASRDENIKALILDSVSVSSDDLLESVVQKRFPFASFATSKLAKLVTIPYFQGNYSPSSICDSVRNIKDRKVLMLASSDVPSFQASTLELGKCFTFRVESKTDLSISGYSTIPSTGEQEEAYDQRLIEFFKKSLISQ
jgi:pimeloyl-ACP methyl ester carboxylesterase